MKSITKLILYMIHSYILLNTFKTNLIHIHILSTLIHKLSKPKGWKNYGIFFINNKRKIQ